jgi:putative addiction module component (TIGR02574 family)
VGDGIEAGLRYNGICMSRVPINEILGLPPSERVELAQRIWESVFDHPEDLALTSAQKEELERRWAAFERCPDEGESWEAVKRSLLDE